MIIISVYNTSSIVVYIYIYISFIHLYTIIIRLYLQSYCHALYSSYYYLCTVHVSNFNEIFLLIVVSGGKGGALSQHDLLCSTLSRMSTTSRTQ